MKKHLITGITGQDGIFLTREILKDNRNTKIIGISRNKNTKTFYKNLSRLNLKNLEDVEVIDVDLNNSVKVESLLNSIKPDFVYNLAGPSSPYESIENPKKYKQIENIFNNLINGLIKNKNFCNFYQASTSEMFLGSNNEKLNETSPFGPKTPYALSKLENHMKIMNLREEYEWKIFSGIMFNHESEFRKDNYLFMKIINTAKEIKENKKEILTIGSLHYKRDWTFAGDTAKAIYKIINFAKDGLYVIGSGKENTIEDIITIVFDYFELNKEEKIVTDESLLREGDSTYIVSDPSKIKSELNWKAKLSFDDLVLRCLKSRI